jgi:carboxylesterase type B
LDHLVINKGNNLYHGKPLFRGAIMDSGSVFPGQSVGSSKAQAVYDQVVTAANCSSGHLDSLRCLRDLPYPQFRAAVETFPDLWGYSSLDIPYIPRFDPNDDGFFSTSPEVAVQCGEFANVPIIIGDQEDEGTLFSLAQFNLTSTEELIDYFTPIYSKADRQVLVDLVSHYDPDDPSAGSPFRTGTANQIYPQYKRLAAILGDLDFQWPRRKFLATAIAAEVPAWSYLSSYLYGTPVLGSFHTTDVLGLLDEALGLLSAEVIDSIQTYYISFIDHLDPNTPVKDPSAETKAFVRSREPPVLQRQIGQVVLGNGNGDGDGDSDSVSDPNRLQYWPRYDESRKELLNFGNHSNQIIRDDFREKAFEFYADHQESFRD